MSSGVKHDINVTPLVDIVLVLLIVFITLVPSLPNALATALPRSGGSGPVHPATRLTLGADGSLEMDGEKLSLSELPDRIRHSSGRVVIRVHPSLRFQQATHVLDVVKGVRRDATFAMVATPDD